MGTQVLTFADISRSVDGYLRVPQVERDEVRLLWYSDYWDGPQSGMLIFGGKQCWFEVVVENEDSLDWNRRFAILTLSADQLADENRWHDLFHRCVGTHTDYTEYDDQQDGPPEGIMRPRELHSEFYDAYKQREPRDYSKCEVLGWFQR